MENGSEKGVNLPGFAEQIRKGGDDRALAIRYLDRFGRRGGIVPGTDRVYWLTAQEEAVIELVRAGKTIGDIATRLGISRTGARGALFRLRRKLGAKGEGHLIWLTRTWGDRRAAQ